MAEKAIELILLRQLATHLTMPVFVIDDGGTLVYYNEPAETLLGLRYDETGEMPVNEWGSLFTPRNDDGEPLPPHELPIVVALEKGRPTHGSFSIRGLDGVPRHISVTALPIDGQSGRRLGAVAIWWEDRQP